MLTKYKQSSTPHTRFLIRKTWSKDLGLFRTVVLSLFLWAYKEITPDIAGNVWQKKKRKERSSKRNWGAIGPKTENPKSSGNSYSRASTRSKLVNLTVNDFVKILPSIHAYRSCTIFRLISNQKWANRLWSTRRRRRVKLEATIAMCAIASLKTRWFLYLCILQMP